MMMIRHYIPAIITAVCFLPYIDVVGDFLGSLSVFIKNYLYHQGLCRKNLQQASALFGSIIGRVHCGLPCFGDS